MMTEQSLAGLEEQLRVLETQVKTLSQAVRALAHGLEENPSQAPLTFEGERERAARAACLAHEILLARGL